MKALLAMSCTVRGVCPGCSASAGSGGAQRGQGPVQGVMVKGLQAQQARTSHCGQRGVARAARRRWRCAGWDEGLCTRGGGVGATSTAGSEEEGPCLGQRGAVGQR